MRTIRLKKGWVGPSLAIPLVGFVILAGCGKRPYVTVSSPKVITVSEWKQSNAAQEARGLLSRYLNASESDAATSQTLMFRSLSSLQGSTTRRDFISTSTGVSVRADALGDITNALTQNDIVTTNTVTQRSERLDVAGRPTNDFTSSTTTTLTSPVLEALKSPEGVALLKGILTDSGPAETFYDPPIDTLEQAMDVFQNYAAKVNNTLDGRLKMMTVTPAVDVDVTQAGAARSVLATSANRAAHYELFRLGSEVEKQLGRLAALEAEKKSLQSQIKEFDAKLKTPNAVLADSKLQITAANNAIAAQAQRLSSMLTKRDMAETAATSGVTTELEVKASLHSKEQLKLAQILVNEAQAELQSLKQQLAVAEKTKSATDTLIAAIETKKAEAEKKVTSIAELKTSVSGQLKAAEAALKAHASDNAAKIAAFREAAATLAAHDVKSENTYSIDDIGFEENRGYFVYAAMADLPETRVWLKAIEPEWRSLTLQFDVSVVTPEPIGSGDYALVNTKVTPILDSAKVGGNELVDITSISPKRIYERRRESIAELQEAGFDFNAAVRAPVSGVPVQAEIVRRNYQMTQEINQWLGRYPRVAGHIDGGHNSFGWQFFPTRITARRKPWVFRALGSFIIPTPAYKLESRLDSGAYPCTIQLVVHNSVRKLDFKTTAYSGNLGGLSSRRKATNPFGDKSEGVDTVVLPRVVFQENPRDQLSGGKKDTASAAQKDVVQLPMGTPAPPPPRF